MWKVTRVAEWTGWCSPCGSSDRPLVLTRTGPTGLWAWLSGHGDEDCTLQLTCRVCGEWQVVPAEADDAELVTSHDSPSLTLAQVGPFLVAGAAALVPQLPGVVLPSAPGPVRATGGADRDGSQDVAAHAFAAELDLTEAGHALDALTSATDGDAARLLAAAPLSEVTRFDGHVMSASSVDESSPVLPTVDAPSEVGSLLDAMLLVSSFDGPVLDGSVLSQDESLLGAEWPSSFDGSVSSRDESVLDAQLALSSFEASLSSDEEPVLDTTSVMSSIVEPSVDTVLTASLDALTSAALPVEQDDAEKYAAATSALDLALAEDVALPSAAELFVDELADEVAMLALTGAVPSPLTLGTSGAASTTKAARSLWATDRRPRRLHRSRTSLHRGAARPVPPSMPPTESTPLTQRTQLASSTPPTPLRPASLPGSGSGVGPASRAASASRTDGKSARSAAPLPSSDSRTLNGGTPRPRGRPRTGAASLQAGAGSTVPQEPRAALSRLAWSSLGTGRRSPYAGRPARTPAGMSESWH